MNTDIRAVAIIGTGILGTQIALLSAYAGNRVRTFDPVEGAFAVAYDRIEAELRARKVTPRIPWNQWQAARDGVEQRSELAEAVHGADLVIEAVWENLELKQKVFAKIGRHAPPGAMVATSSSTFPVARMEAASGRGEFCLNMHFYFPLQGVNMADIMGGSQTLPAVLKRGEQWIRSVGCIPLRVKKVGTEFCFSGLWRTLEHHALHLWGDEIADFRDIDRAWMVFTDMSEGPFGLMDKVGLDLVYDMEMASFQESNDPKDRPPACLQEKIRRGELGVKSGKGFYSYPKPEFLSPDFLNPP